jgi:hypothetical protein
MGKWLNLFISLLSLNCRERQKKNEESNCVAERGVLVLFNFNMWVFYETFWFGLVVCGRCETGSVILKG